MRLVYVTTVCTVAFVASACSDPPRRRVNVDANTSDFDAPVDMRTAGRGGAGGAGGTGGAGGGGGSAGADAARELAPDAPPDRTPDLPPDLTPDRPGREAARDVNMMTADLACTRLATATCDRFERCAGTYLISRDYGTKAACLAAEKNLCLGSTLRPWSGATPMRTDACATALNASPCSDLGVALAGCPPAVGGIEDDGTCVASSQCSSSRCIISSPNVELCGKCFPAIAIVPEGGACVSSGECVPGLVCPSTAMCTAPALFGEACSSAKPCRTGFLCLGGTCTARIAMEGAACESPPMTIPDCDDRVGLVCRTDAPDGGTTDASADGGADPDASTDGAPADASADDAAADAGTTKKCVRNLLADIGGTCGTLADGTLVICKNGGLCQRPLVMDAGTARSPTGTCVANAGLGQPCDSQPQTGPRCEVGLRCIHTGMTGTVGTCKVLDFAACP